MKSDLSRSAASSPSLRSRSALSMRKRSVTSLKVTRVAPSGRGEVDSDRMERSERSTSPRSRAAAPATMAWINWSQMRAVAELVAREGGDGAHMRLAFQVVAARIPRCGRRRHCAASACRRDRTPPRLRSGCRASPTAPSSGCCSRFPASGRAVTSSYRKVRPPKGCGWVTTRMVWPPGMCQVSSPDFSRCAVAVKRQARALPGLIVALLGQFAALAQPVQDFAVAGMLVQEAFRQAPQLAQRPCCRSSASGRGRRSPPRSAACPSVSAWASACCCSLASAAATSVTSTAVPITPASPSGISVKASARRWPFTTEKRRASWVAFCARAWRPDRARPCPAPPVRGARFPGRSAPAPLRKA